MLKALSRIHNPGNTDYPVTEAKRKEDKYNLWILFSFQNDTDAQTAKFESEQI